MARAASGHPQAKELASLAFEGFTMAVAQADGWANVHANLSVRFGEPSRAHRALDLRTVPVGEAVGQGGLHTALGPSPLVPQLVEIRHPLTHAQIDAIHRHRPAWEREQCEHLGVARKDGEREVAAPRLQRIPPPCAGR